MNKKILETLKNFLIWFSIFYLAFWAFSLWQGDREEERALTGLQAEWARSKLVQGLQAQIRLHNHTDSLATVEPICTTPGTLAISRQVSGQTLELELPECADQTTFEIAAGQSGLINFPEINHQVFAETGYYQVSLQVTQGEEKQTVSLEPLRVVEPGFWRTSFRSIITQPLFNLLAALVIWLPGHNLGIAIIALTVLIRVLLFPWNHKAMKSQRRLQKMQPEIEALKKKHGKNQQALAMATMSLYQKHKINPMSSCWPMLLQMPFLIGIYFVVIEGFTVTQSHLMYGFMPTFDWNLISHQFLGLDLRIPNIFVLPILVGGAQFAAIKLSMISAKKQAPTPAKKKTKEAEGQFNMASQMEQMQKMMLWVLPIMIGVFTATFPAAVGIYWLASTVFGVGQQKLVNWQLDQPQVVKRSKS